MNPSSCGRRPRHCTCSYGPEDEIEIVLTVKGIEVERLLFGDANTAADRSVVVSCPKCHAAVGRAKFCPECGTAVSLKRSCGACSAEIPGSSKFCPECGAKS